MNIQEASKDITKGRNFDRCSKTSYMKENTQRTNNTGDYTQENALMRLQGMNHAPQAWKITLRHPWLYFMFPGHGKNTPILPRHAENAPPGKFKFFFSFPTFKWKKPSFEAQTQLETSPINTFPLIYYFSFRTKRWFKRNENTRSFKGGVSLLTRSL